MYSPVIDARSIRPGTVIYDPNGHVATIYRIESDGRIRYMDAHPDSSLTRGFYDLTCAVFAYFAGAIKSKELTPHVHRFDDAIRDESNNGFSRDTNTCFSVLNLARNSKREVCV